MQRLHICHTHTHTRTLPHTQTRTEAATLTVMIEMFPLNCALCWGNNVVQGLRWKEHKKEGRKASENIYIHI